MRLSILLVLFAVAAIAQTHSVALSWTTGAGNPAPPATTANVYRIAGTCPANPTWGTPLNTATIAGTAYTDLAVTATSTYCYAVTNIVNGVESVKSAAIQAVIPPSIPTGLSAVPQ